MLLWENQMIISIIRMWLLFGLAYVCRWNKVFFLRACIKEDDILTFLKLGFIFDHILALRRINFFAMYLIPAEICPMPSVILCFICRVKIFAINYLTLPLARSQFIFLKCDWSIWHLVGKFKQKRLHLFWAFWIFL